MISVTSPIDPAADWTRRMLFSPFEIKKWLIIGFSVFLSELSQGFFLKKPSHVFEPNQILEHWGLAWDWAQAHLVLSVILAAASLVLMGAIFALTQWLGSRGVFILLDNIVNDRAEIVSPWRKNAKLANSLFLFRLIFGLISIMVLIAIGLLCYFLAKPDIVAGKFGVSAIISIFTGVILFSFSFTSILTVFLVLVDFIAPIMYKLGVLVKDAILIFRREMMPGRIAALTLFYLMRFAFSLMLAFLMMVVGILTFSIGFFPYLSSVICLPVFVFMRCYSLFFLAQWGEGWKLLAEGSNEHL